MTGGASQRTVMLVGVESSTSRSVGASETGKREARDKINKQHDDNTVSDCRTSSIKFRISYLSSVSR